LGTFSAATTSLEQLGGVLKAIPEATDAVVEGLVGMKIAMATRLLELLSYAASPVTQLWIPSPPASPENPGSSTSNDGSFLSYPNLISQLNLPNKTIISLNGTFSTLNLTLSEDREYFPVPGLKIGFDNETGKYALTHSSDYYPSVLLPPNYVNYDGYNNSSPYVIHNQMTLFDLLNISKNHEYLLYPVLPTNVNANNVQEPGYLSVSNTSQLLRVADGKVSKLDANAGISFEGFSPDNIEQSESHVVAITSKSVDLGQTSTTTPTVEATTSTVNVITPDNSLNEISDTPRLSKKANDIKWRLQLKDAKLKDSNVTVFGAPLAMRLNRSKRHLTPYVVPRYFNMIHTLDTDKCFSEVVCQIGANHTIYGKYGHNLNNFLQAYNSTSFPANSTSQFYIHRFYLGKINGTEVCKEAVCEQDMISLVKSIQAF
jgi:hypothetical protein